MDRSSGKADAGRTSRKPCGLKDAAKQRDEGAQFCNRIGCHGRVKYSHNTRTGSSDKVQTSSPSTSSSNNTLTRKSSMNSSMTTPTRKSYLDSKGKSSSQLNLDPSGSSLSGESEALEFISSSSGSESTKKSGEETVRETRRPRMSVSSSSNRTRAQSESIKKPTVRETRKHGISANAVMPSSSSRTSYQSEPMKKCQKITARETTTSRTSGNALMSSPSSSTREHLESKWKSRAISSNVRPRTLFHDRSRLHNQNTPPSAIGPFDSKSSTSVGASKSGGKMRSSVGNSQFNNSHLRRGISISLSTSGSGAAPVSNHRSASLSSQRGSRRSSIAQPAVRMLESPDNVGHQSTPQHLSEEFSRSSLTLSGGNIEDEYLHYLNMFGISIEDLQCFETYEEAEEWIQEALGIHEYTHQGYSDQHQDMRLDIDNMSYEELLALEERMGTVSTALSEEALSKCLSRSVYQPDPSKVQTSETDEDGQDRKCSICQDEYVFGDEIGKLVDCEHEYHVTCINEWLQIKNWCPICKISAGPSQSSLSL